MQQLRCRMCGESGDFADVNDSRIEEALDSSKKASIPTMLVYLDACGLSNAYIERVFQLPSRTIARWKRGEESGAALAFLRLLRTYPWLAKVADAGFDRLEADVAVYRAACEARLQDNVSSAGVGSAGPRR